MTSSVAALGSGHSHLQVHRTVTAGSGKQAARAGGAITAASAAETTSTVTNADGSIASVVTGPGGTIISTSTIVAAPVAAPQPRPLDIRV